MEKQNEKELVIKVRKGVKVKVEETDDAKQLGDRDVTVRAGKSLKLEIHKIDSRDISGVASKITMCG